MMFSKVECNGDNTHPVYAYLRYNSELRDKKTNKVARTPWNFAKFIVSDEGKTVSYYNPLKNPRQLDLKIKTLCSK